MGCESVGVVVGADVVVRVDWWTDDRFRGAGEHGALGYGRWGDGDVCAGHAVFDGVRESDVAVVWAQVHARECGAAGRHVCGDGDDELDDCVDESDDWGDRDAHSLGGVLDRSRDPATAIRQHLIATLRQGRRCDAAEIWDVAWSRRDHVDEYSEFEGQNACWTSQIGRCLGDADVTDAAGRVSRRRVGWRAIGRRNDDPTQ